MVGEKLGEGQSSKIWNEIMGKDQEKCKVKSKKKKKCSKVIKKS